MDINGIPVASPRNLFAKKRTWWHDRTTFEVDRSDLAAAPCLVAGGSSQIFDLFQGVNYYHTLSFTMTKILENSHDFPIRYFPNISHTSEKTATDYFELRWSISPSQPVSIRAAAPKRSSVRWWRRVGRQAMEFPVSPGPPKSLSWFKTPRTMFYDSKHEVYKPT